MHTILVDMYQKCMNTRRTQRLAPASDAYLQIAFSHSRALVVLVVQESVCFCDHYLLSCLFGQPGIIPSIRISPSIYSVHSNAHQEQPKVLVAHYQQTLPDHQGTYACRSLRTVPTVHPQRPDRTQRCHQKTDDGGDDALPINLP